eukprot:3191915-Amphidinium_carterae.1
MVIAHRLPVKSQQLVLSQLRVQTMLLSAKGPEIIRPFAWRVVEDMPALHAELRGSGVHPGSHVPWGLWWELVIHFGRP